MLHRRTLIVKILINNFILTTDNNPDSILKFVPDRASKHSSPKKLPLQDAHTRKIRFNLTLHSFIRTCWTNLKLLIDWGYLVDFQTGLGDLKIQLVDIVIIQML